MEKTIIPRPLKAGDTVALVAPSGPLPKGRLQQTLDALESMGLGYVVYPSVHMAHGYFAGDDAQRAKDVEDAFLSDDIDGVICVRGGYGAQRLYHLINWHAVACHPKVFAGYSDVTFMHIVLNQMCGMRTYHTPMPSTEWYKGLDDYTQHWLQCALFGQPWGTLDNCAGAQMQTLSGGCAQGMLVGGNLSLVASSIGTPYELCAKDRILFLEDIDEEPYRIDGMLLQMRASGMLDGCKGILLGYFTDCQAKHPERSLTLAQVFEELLLPLGIPVLAGVTCGHSEPTLSLPLGAHVFIDADEKIIKIMEE